MVLGTVAFGGIGLLLAGTLKPLVNLAVVNALFVVLLLLGGMLIPLAKLPGWLADIAKVLPASALADALHGTLGPRDPGHGPGLGGAGGLGRGRPGGGRPHLPLGVSRRRRAGRSAADARARSPGPGQPPEPASRCSHWVSWTGDRTVTWPTTWPEASMKKVWGSALSP